MPLLAQGFGWEVGNFVVPLVLRVQRHTLDTLDILGIPFLGILVVPLGFD